MGTVPLDSGKAVGVGSDSYHEYQSKAGKIHEELIMVTGGKGGRVVKEHA